MSDRASRVCFTSHLTTVRSPIITERCGSNAHGLCSQFGTVGAQSPPSIDIQQQPKQKHSNHLFSFLFSGIVWPKTINWRRKDKFTNFLNKNHASPFHLVSHWVGISRWTLFMNCYTTSPNREHLPERNNPLLWGFPQLFIPLFHIQIAIKQTRQKLPHKSSKLSFHSHLTFMQTRTHFFHVSAMVAILSGGCRGTCLIQKYGLTFPGCNVFPISLLFNSCIVLPNPHFLCRWRQVGHLFLHGSLGMSCVYVCVQTGDFLSSSLHLYLMCVYNVGRRRVHHSLPCQWRRTDSEPTGVELTELSAITMEADAEAAFLAPTDDAMTPTKDLMTSQPQQRRRRGNEFCRLEVQLSCVSLRATRKRHWTIVSCNPVRYMECIFVRSLSLPTFLNLKNSLFHNCQKTWKQRKMLKCQIRKSQEFLLRLFQSQLQQESLWFLPIDSCKKSVKDWDLDDQ